MKTKFFSRFDFFLIIVTSILVTLGIFFIYSSNINSDGILVIKKGAIAEHVKQIIFASIGLIVIIFFALFDYRKYDDYSWILYGILIAVLIYTKFFGAELNNARSWIKVGTFTLQPSEFGKIIFIIVLAKYLYKSEGENQLKRFIISILIMLLPLGLILIQPDLGTAIVYVPIFLFICLFAGIPIKYILYILSLGVFTILFTVLPIWNTNLRDKPLQIINLLTNMKLRFILIAVLTIITLLSFVIKRYFHGPKFIYWFIYVFSILALSLILSLVVGKILKPHQISRLIIFINPYVDPRGDGWNIIQSRIAIGSGGAFGQSFLQGTQSHLNYLPEQSTDFIFSILSEELGFVGCFIVFVLYMCLLIRSLIIIWKCPNRFGINVAAGIFGMLSFHFFVNIGMVIGIMPVVGIPLLFLSYGGSSLLTGCMAIGLLQSVNYRKNEFN